MACAGTAECTCGCCAGTSVATPQRVGNAAGQPALNYRVGSWRTFKESMLARLSSADYPALQTLTTRSDDDFTIALLDASAVMLDVLTFYQERLANETYLRTAQQLRSLTELSRLVGYRPVPGVSASTYLGFSLKVTPGQPPDPSAAPIIIPSGTKVQSVPAQGQTPQTFETAADIAAKPDWNALAVQTGQSWSPAGATSLYLTGTSTQLQQGDSLLILGIQREQYDGISSPSDQWDVVVLNRVDTDRTRNVTHVAWDKTLTHGSQNKSNPSTWTVVKVFAFRQKASLFGHNAPNPNLFVNANDPTGKTTSLPELINHGQLPWTWKSFQIGSSDRIDLDASYPKIVVGGWFALVEGVAQLYKVKAASAISRADFALSGKVTELAADFGDPDIAAFQLPTTDVWAQSDQLDVAEVPLDYPLYGAVVPLAGLRIDLAGAPAVALSGRRQKIAVRDGVMFLRFVQGSSSRPLQPGEILTLSDPAPLPVQPDGTISDWNSNDAPLTLYVEDARGRAGTVTAALSDFTLAPSDNNDPIVSEYALLTAVDTTSDPAHARLLLAAPLGFCYDRFATTVNANVGLATHGQTVSEILGSGDPTTPNQTFPLKQSPLTYVQAATPTGRSSTLTVRVSGVDWSEVASLYEASPSASVYTTFYQADGSTEVVFGDGIEGALLPTGQSNLQATYRVGSGAAGNVAQGALATLIDRPLGVSGVTNPAAATGGQDPQSVDDIRANAPLSVLTLGRAVSIVDYENFARSFAGIAKAHALWIANGPGRGVFLTVSGSGGAALPPGNPTLAKLLAALQGCSNPLTAITTHSYVETLFSFSAELRCDPAYDRGQVESDVRAQLVRSFGFAARAFGQAVGVDELTAIIQGVPGVVAVNVTGLARGLSSTGGDLAGLGGYGNVAALNYWLAHQISLDRLFADTPTRLCAYLPVADAQTLPQPAEILVLDPDPAKLVLGAMS